MCWLHGADLKTWKTLPWPADYDTAVRRVTHRIVKCPGSLSADFCFPTPLQYLHYVGSANRTHPEGTMNRRLKRQLITAAAILIGLLLLMAVISRFA